MCLAWVCTARLVELIVTIHGAADGSVNARRRASLAGSDPHIMWRLRDGRLPRRSDLSTRLGAYAEMPRRSCVTF